MPKLTPASVEKHKPGKTRREIPDAASPGLYLIIQPGSGTKSFAMRFRNGNGRHVKLTLGPLDLTGNEAVDAPVLGQPLTLISARRLASEMNRQRALGKDTVALRHRERLERKAGQAKDFSTAALDFVEQYLKRKVRRWQASARLLGVVIGDDGKLAVMPKGLTDRWRDRPIKEINSDDIHQIVKEVREKAVPGLKRYAYGPSDAMARSMFAVLSRLFRWLLEERRITVNPVIGVAMPESPEPRERTLTDDEIKKFWIACEKIGEPASQCLKLLLLTGCRLNEIAQLRRSEINDKDRTATIPSNRVKNKKSFVLPLSPMAWNILQSVQTKGDLFFTTERGKPIGPWSRIKRQLDAEMKTAPWRTHDLRRCFSTNLNKIGIAPHVVETCLNHVSGHKGSVAGVYNTYQYLPEKTQAMNRWTDHVAGLIEGRAAKIFVMKRKRVAK
jgi:integrase